MKLQEVVEDGVRQLAELTRPLTPEEMFQPVCRETAPSEEWLRNFASRVEAAVRDEGTEFSLTDTIARVKSYMDTEYQKPQTAQVRTFIERLRTIIQ